MIEKEIIKISETNTGVQTVLASDLYNLLTPKTQFRDWIKRMLKYGFLENVDYWTLSSIEANVFRSKMSEKENTPKKGRKLIDYIVTVECAKAIAMVQRSEIGRKIRNYFIEAEKEFRKLATPEQIKSLYTKIEKLESNKVDFTNDWTIDRFLRTNGLTESSSNVFKQQLGKKCTKYLKQKTGNTPKKVQHPSYLNGQNVYPYELINQVYSEIIKK